VIADAASANTDAFRFPAQVFEHNDKSWNDRPPRPFAHQLFEIAVIHSVAAIPAHCPQDHFNLKVTGAPCRMTGFIAAEPLVMTPAGIAAAPGQ